MSEIRPTTRTSKKFVGAMDEARMSVANEGFQYGCADATTGFADNSE